MLCRSFVLLLLLLLCSPGALRGQAPPTPASPPQSMGVTTGGTYAPVLDAEKRPITAGGFVKTGPVVFQDIATKAGLTVWHHTMGTPRKQFILEAPGSGVALLDYDKDGWLDIYMVNGSTYEALAGKAPAPHAALFHNNLLHKKRGLRRGGDDPSADHRLLPLRLSQRSGRLDVRKDPRVERQRRLPRPVRRQLRQEPSLSQ